MRVNAVLWKRQLLLEFRSKLSGESIDKAKSDSHAKRRVRPCGLTVHPGEGCPYTCSYCYVPQLNSDFIHLKPSTLDGRELVFSLLSNPQFVPGRMGTFLPFGSLCDPFHPDCVEKTLDFLDYVAENLENPCQFSTKMYLSEEMSHRLSRLEGSSLSPLVSFTTWEQAELLEPNVPSPAERMESVSNLKEAGLKPILFLRPIIPGVTDEELDILLWRGKEAGAVGVIFGSLKVSQGLLSRLKEKGVNLDSVSKRRGVTTTGDRLISMPSSEFKTKAAQKAKELGLIPFLSSCCANAYTAQVPCTSLCWTSQFCTQCPNACSQTIPYLKREELTRAVRLLLGTEPRRIELHSQKVTIHLPARLNAREVRKYIPPLQVITRKRVQIRTS
ncbi:MAG: radical SAM protein [Thermoproteota archaeon]